MCALISRWVVPEIQESMALVPYLKKKCWRLTCLRAFQFLLSNHWIASSQQLVARCQQLVLCVLQEVRNQSIIMVPKSLSLQCCWGIVGNVCLYFAVGSVWEVKEVGNFYIKSRVCSARLPSRGQLCPCRNPNTYMNPFSVAAFLLLYCMQRLKFTCQKKFLEFLMIILEK